MERAYSRWKTSRQYRNRKTSRTNQLKTLFGEAVDDIERMFFSLQPEQLERVFSEYGKSFGKAAESYARHTYENWRSGQTSLSGQTIERLIDFLPMHLSDRQRYALIKKIRREYLVPMVESIIVTPRNWKEGVERAIERAISISRSTRMPDSLRNIAKWLSDGDSALAQEMLVAAEEEEALLRRSYLEAEFGRIELLIEAIGRRGRKIFHTIEIPQGEIRLTIKKARKRLWPTVKEYIGGAISMKKDNNALISQDEINKSLILKPSSGNLIDKVTSNLSDDQIRTLADRVIDEKINLDVQEKQADQRFRDSTRDMVNTVNAARAIEQSTNADYVINSVSSTASGTTTITIKKYKGLAIIIACIIIGIVLLTLLKR